MASPGTIVRYTGQGGGFRWDQYGIDVDSANPLEVVAPDVADLVDADNSIPLEKYPEGDINSTLTIVDGLDIAPNSVAVDAELTAGQVGTEMDPIEAYPETEWSVHSIPAYATSGDGTASNKWIDGWNAALDDIPDGKMGLLWAPPGHYELTSRVEMKRGIRSRDGLSAANDEHTMPMIMGGGRYTTSIYRGDGMNDHMFYYDESDDVGQNEFIIGGGMADLALLGNKANNTSGDNIHFVNPDDSSGFIQQIYRDMFVRLAPERNLNAESRAINEMEFRNVTFNRADVQNVTILDAVARITFVDCKFNFCQGSTGVKVVAENPQGGGEFLFLGCRFRNDFGQSLTAEGDLVRCVGCQWVTDSGVSKNDQVYIVNRASNAYYHGYIDARDSDTAITDAIFLGGPGNDVDFDLDVLGTTNVFDSGGSTTRPKWQGTIGGGPLGGVDLSSTTGQYLGQPAVADGTSTANAGDLARWNGSSWDVFQPATTV